MIIDPYGIFQIFLGGLAFEYILVQIIKYRKEKEEIGYIWLILLGVEVLIYSLCEAYISQGNPPLLGEVVTKFQHSVISIFPIILLLYWYTFLKDEKIKKITYIFIILTSFQIITLWFNIFNIHGDFIIKRFNKGTIFEITQWGYVETGFFGYFEIFLIFVPVVLLTIYLIVSPKTKRLEKEKKYFFISTGIFTFTMLNDILVLWLDGYNMYFLNGIGIIIMIYALNHFIIAKEQKLEKSLHEFEEILKDSEEKYRFLFEKTPVSIILLDEDGLIADCNPACEKLTRYSKEELIGTKFHKLGKYQDDLFPTVLKRLRRYLEAGKLPPLEIQLFRKDTSVIWVQIHTTLVKISDVAYIQIIGFNISNRKKAEQIVEEEVQKLKELDRIRKDLISRVSHELKTPIMAISGASELLTARYQEEMAKDANELVKMIERGGKRLKVLVDRLLDIDSVTALRLAETNKKSQLYSLLL